MQSPDPSVSIHRYPTSVLSSGTAARFRSGKLIDAFIEVKSEYVPNLPSWTAVGVTELYSPRAFIEVKVIAAVSDGG